MDSTAWAQIDRCVGSELGDLLGEPFTSTSDVPGPVIHASRISLTLPEEGLQVMLCLGIDSTTCSLLQQALLGGDPSIEALDDALREMANTAAGAIKRAALDDGSDLTISLPSTIPWEEASVGRAWLLAGESGIRVSCVAIATRVAQSAVVTSELREGMVLSRDALDAAGELVAPAGISLTSTTVDLLVRRLRATAKLDVSYTARS